MKTNSGILTNASDSQIFQSATYPLSDLGGGGGG